MAAQQKVSSDQLLKTIREWSGNVRAAADRLGILPKSLRKRLLALGIGSAELAQMRGIKGVIGKGSTDPHGSLGPHRTPLAPMGTSDPFASGWCDPLGGGGPKSSSDPYPKPGRRSSLSTVQQPTAAMVEGTDEIPIRTVPRVLKPIRLSPMKQDRLREATRALEARYRVDTDESVILDQFFDEAFEAWLKAKMAGGSKKGGK